MTSGGNVRPEEAPENEDAENEMARFGITRVPADIYRYRGYRYSNLHDALAQARRDPDIVHVEAE